jgi:predicted nucleic acid-binding protein
LGGEGPNGLTPPSRGHAGNHRGLRAGAARARLIAKGRRARLADALIARSCVDHDVPLVTNDADFAQLAAGSSLRVLP